MKERPILFTAPMVRAILAGTKTQTRRVVTPQPEKRHMVGVGPMLAFKKKAGPDYWLWPNARDEVLSMCPYGQPGNRLWVRETWQSFFDDEMPPDRPRGPRHTMGQPSRPDRKSFVFYKADGPGPGHPDGSLDRWFSPLHLPRKYSRITLEVTAVRVERLQDISEADAIAEGVEWNKCPTYQTEQSRLAQQMANRVGMAAHYEAKIDYVGGYRWLWESINGPGSWDANPWVWCVEFKRLDP